MIGSGCNIGSKTFLAERGKLPLKFICPAGTSTYPATLLNKDELHCEDSAQNITAGRSKLGSCSACPTFCQIHLQLSTGQAVMLHTDDMVNDMEIIQNLTSTFLEKLSLLKRRTL